MKLTKGKLEGVRHDILVNRDWFGIEFEMKLTKHSIKKQLHPIRGQVANQVWNQVRVQVWDQIYETIK